VSPGIGAESVPASENEQQTATAAVAATTPELPALGSGGPGKDVRGWAPAAPSPPDLEGQPKSYGLNLVTQNGMRKDADPPPPLLLLHTDTAGASKTGLWKHETTV